MCPKKAFHLPPAPSITCATTPLEHTRPLFAPSAAEATNEVRVVPSALPIVTRERGESNLSSLRRDQSRILLSAVRSPVPPDAASKRSTSPVRLPAASLLGTSAKERLESVAASWLATASA